MLYLVALCLVIAQLSLPRHLAFIPILVAVFYGGNQSIVSEFTPVRLVIIVGITRAYLGGFFEWDWSHRMDRLFAIFTVVALASSFGHEANEYIPSPLIERVGLVLNVLGTYLFSRAYFSQIENLEVVAVSLVFILIPFSMLMSVEKVTGKNYYGKVGIARATGAIVRNGGYRAQGPFGHAIIAGTAAASTIPLMAVLYRRNRKRLALIGMVSGFAGVVASASSGPMAALAAGLLFLWFWRKRHLFHQVKWGIICLLIFLNFTMSRPIWFLIARIDIVGGSTGWHRSILIDTAMNRLDEWWLAGTDFTRHWIHSGVTWNPYHADITNYYLQMGVLGGLPLMLTLLFIIYRGCGELLGETEWLRSQEDVSDEQFEENDEKEFDLWCIWVTIMVHCISFISIAYFDQSYALFFALFGMIPAFCGNEEELEPSVVQEPIEV